MVMGPYAAELLARGRVEVTAAHMTIAVLRGREGWAPIGALCIRLAISNLELVGELLDLLSVEVR
jgi:hypothetical protein